MLDQNMKRATICLLSPALSPAVPAQPVSFLGERLLRGIIATCHSQVNSPPSLCSGEQSLFSLSSVGALRLAFEPCSTNTSIWTSHSVSCSQPERFVCLETREHVGQSVWHDDFSCLAGALKQISALLSKQEILLIDSVNFSFHLSKIRFYKRTIVHERTC